jgi:hypothetical protein
MLSERLLIHLAFLMTDVTLCDDCPSCRRIKAALTTITEQ